MSVVRMRVEPKAGPALSIWPRMKTLMTKSESRIMTRNEETGK